MGVRTPPVNPWLKDDRISMLLTATVYPLWGGLIILLDIPGIVDDLPGRFMVGGLALALWAASYKFATVARYFSSIALGTLLIEVSHHFYLTNLNNMNEYFAIGAFVLIFSAAGSINVRRLLAIYSGFTLGLSIVCTTGLEFSDRLFFFLAVATSLSMTYVSTNRRLKMVAAAKKDQRLIAAQQAQLSSSAKWTALGEMAGGIAHEINTPLSSMTLQLELLRELVDGPSKLEAIKIVESAEAMTAKIAGIIRNLRTFARDATNDPMKVVRIKAIIDETLLLCDSKLLDSKIRIGLTYSRKDMTVRGRAVELEQALLNLISNAHLAVAGQPDPKVSIEVAERPNGLTIDVIDNGPGIDPKIADKIFQPFFTTRKIGQGTGLGLCVARGIVEAHGGTLAMVPVERGARFQIFLPFAEVVGNAA